MGSTVLGGRPPEGAAGPGLRGRATPNSRIMLAEGELGIGKTSILPTARDTHSTLRKVT
jgi:hypothetical protein